METLIFVFLKSLGDSIGRFLVPMRVRCRKSWERRHPCRRIARERFTGKGAGAPGNGSLAPWLNAPKVRFREILP